MTRGMTSLTTVGLGQIHQGENTMNTMSFKMDTPNTVSGFSNDQVLAEIRKCVCAEKESLADFLELLIEVDQRQLFLLDSCPSSVSPWPERGAKFRS